MNKEDALRLAKDGKNSAGKTLYKKYLSGARLNATQSISAKCYTCMNGYIDGRNNGDCQIETCPLYPKQPYGKKRKRLKNENRTVTSPVQKRIAKNRSS